MASRFQVSRFSRDVLTLVTGTTAGQAIPIMMLPVLTRLYSEADFGLLTTYTATSLLFARVASLKYEFAIVLEKDPEGRANLTFFGLLLAFSMALLVGATVFILRPWLDQQGWNELGHLLYLVPLTVVAVGAYEVLNYRMNSQGRFKTIAGSKLVQSGLAEGANLGGGMRQWGVGLVWGRVVGEVAALCYMVTLSWRGLAQDWKLVKRQKVWSLAVKHRDFLRYSTPSAFLGSTLINFLYAWLLGYYFGKEVLGNVGLATGYVSVGLGIISRSFAQVYYKELAGLHTQEELRKVYQKHMLRLFAVSASLVIGAYLVPSTVVVWLLGDQWTNLMDYLRIVIIWISISFVSSSLSFIYIRLRRQRTMMYFDGLHLLMVAVGISGGYAWFGTVKPTLWCYTIAQSVFYLLAIVLAFVFINRFRPESQ
ncbi:MAG: lipopolysaccharide biosynthesis protein [Salibacteraceae bacterium]